MLKIGVLGVGHLGNIHLECLNRLDNYQLVGIYDPKLDRAEQAASQYSIRQFSSEAELIEAVDVVDVVTPTITHFELAEAAIRRGRHVFIEKPLTHTLEEAKALVQLANEVQVKVQVGHVERFNPAFLALDGIPLNPMFIEAHRLALFNPRGTDVSVVLDLMIHDLDIILSMVKSDIKQISANGVPIVSRTADIVNTRIEFENGCVANLTASRISLKQMRKVRFFQRDAYISLNFLDKKAEIIRLYDEPRTDLLEAMQLFELDTEQGKRWIQLVEAKTTPTNAIQMELDTFANSILEDKPPRVSLKDGYRALKLAYEVMKTIGEYDL